MKPRIKLFRSLALTCIVGGAPLVAPAQTQVLATIDHLTVTDTDLERALASSPFATQFPSMDEDDQAVLRGSLLRHLVVSRLLRLEAERLGLAQAPEFLRDIQEFRRGLLYRYYMDRLRVRASVPETTLAEIARQLPDDTDARSAARSAYVSERFRRLQRETIRDLAARYHVRIHADRIRPDMPADTLLLEGDAIAIRYGDLVSPQQASSHPEPGWIEAQARKRGELEVVARAAEQAGIDVGDAVRTYREERLAALMLERKQQEWIPDDSALRDYFDAHPEIAHVPGSRHIGQLVVATRTAAETLRRRILAGESLFVLAGELSIDAYGRSHNGDMGWVREDSGAPQIRAALSDLADGEVSPVVETPMGFHLIAILERRPGVDRPFAGMRDKVRQLLIAERMQAYLAELEQRHQVVWNLLEPK